MHTGPHVLGPLQIAVASLNIGLHLLLRRDRRALQNIDRLLLVNLILIPFDSLVGVIWLAFRCIYLL